MNTNCPHCGRPLIREGNIPRCPDTLPKRKVDAKLTSFGVTFGGDAP